MIASSDSSSFSLSISSNNGAGSNAEAEVDQTWDERTGNCDCKAVENVDEGS